MGTSLSCDSAFKVDEHTARLSKYLILLRGRVGIAAEKLNLT